jgi:IS5 family transposase
MTQLNFATLHHRYKKKRTKREAFLAEMEAIVPSALLHGLIERYHPNVGNVRSLMPLRSCCGFISCSNDISSPSQEQKRRSMTSCRRRPTLTPPARNGLAHAWAGTKE